MGRRGLELLRGHIWRERSLPLTFLLALVCLVSREISLLTPFEKRLRQWTVDSYVLFWLGVLIALAAAAPRTGGWGLLVASVGLYRLQDLLFSTLDDALDLTGRFQTFRARSKVVIALVNMVQIVLVFTIVIGVFTSSSDWAGSPNLGRFHCFVLSWSGLVPFGVSTSATEPGAQMISIVESAVAVIILLIALSRFMSLPSGTSTASADGASG